MAERDEQLVGYSVLTRNFFHSFFIELVAVVVTERRSGVGRAMVAYFVDLVPPGEKLWTSTNQSNLPMQALLAKAGFVQSGRVDNLDEGDPELIYLHLGSA